MTLRLATAAALPLALLGAAARAEGPVIAYQVAVLQGLDKVTARVSPIHAPLGIPTYFGRLEIVARACRETPPTEPPESAAFLEIRELPPASDQAAPPIDLFSGWMFASSPAVSALEHPVYDVWVVDCEQPVELPPEGAPRVDQGAPPAPDAPPGELSPPPQDQGVDQRTPP